MAATYHLQVEQGADFDRTFTWKDSMGIPIDLTGYTARMQIRESISAEDVVLELTTENERITIDPQAGKVILHIEAEATAGLLRNGIYDIELVSAEGRIARLVQGKVILSKEVTR